MKLWIGAGLLAASAVAAPVAESAEPTSWVHVRVEDGEDGGRVSVNLPLNVVRAALRLAPDHVVKEGRVRLDHHGDHDVKVADLRELWQGLSAAGDAELVKVEDGDETVRVERAGDRVLVHVDGHGETVRVDVPSQLVDALLSGEGEELNLDAALEHLETLRGDIVQVDGDDATVRIWVDEGGEG